MAETRCRPPAMHTLGPLPTWEPVPPGLVCDCGQYVTDTIHFWASIESLARNGRPYGR
jgi:hypothetical protein